MAERMVVWPLLGVKLREAGQFLTAELHKHNVHKKLQPPLAEITVLCLLSEYAAGSQQRQELESDANS